MKDSELRSRAKALALHIIAICDEIDTRKGRGVLECYTLSTVDKDTKF